MNSVSKILHI